MTPDLIEAPREILTALHEELAAQSPEHASLVAAYQGTRAATRVPPGPVQFFGRSPVQSRLRRIADYAALRGSGLTRKEAAARLGICPRTAVRYEAAMKGTRT